MADSSIIIRHMSSVSQNAPSTLVDFGTAVQKVYINAITNDVLIEPNGSANADSFRVSSASPQPTLFDFSGSQIRTLGLLGVGGSANVYIMGVVT